MASNTCISLCPCKRAQYEQIATAPPPRLLLHITTRTLAAETRRLRRTTRPRPAPIPLASLSTVRVRHRLVQRRKAYLERRSLVLQKIVDHVDPSNWIGDGEGLVPADWDCLEAIFVGVVSFGGK